MNAKGSEVIVVARFKSDLANLAKKTGLLADPCGTAGPSIARKVLEGNGKATVSMNLLKLATETQLGVEVILDNFELYDAKTKAPLLSWLISNYLKSSV